MIPERRVIKDKVSSAQKTAISILSISIIVFFYFAIMILFSKLKYDAILLGVVRETLTIPALVLLAITCIFSIAAFVKNHFRINSLPFYSLTIQLVTIALIVYIA